MSVWFPDNWNYNILAHITESPTAYDNIGQNKNDDDDDGGGGGGGNFDEKKTKKIQVSYFWEKIDQFYKGITMSKKLDLGGPHPQPLPNDA